MSEEWDKIYPTKRQGQELYLLHPASTKMSVQRCEGSTAASISPDPLPVPFLAYKVLRGRDYGSKTTVTCVTVPRTALCLATKTSSGGSRSDSSPWAGKKHTLVKGNNCTTEGTHARLTSHNFLPTVDKVPYYFLNVLLLHRNLSFLVSAHWSFKFEDEHIHLLVRQMGI